MRTASGGEIIKIITRKEAKERGLKRYFTGKPCKNGHIAERQVCNWYCLECAREQNKRYRDENYETRNRKNRQYYADNSEARIEYQRNYRYFNADAITSYKRQYYADNADYCRESARLYSMRNPERRYATGLRRRAAKLDRTLQYKEELTDFVAQESSQQASDMEECFGIPFQVDHMIPLQGKHFSGLHVWYNLQVIPAVINIGKEIA